VKVSDEIQNLRPYAPGKPIEETKRELGLDRVYKLASNENPLGPSSKVLEAIGAELKQLHRYPDAGFFELRQAYSKKYGFPSNCFTFGNGSNEIIDLLIRVFCAPGEAVLTSENAFVAYGICTKAARAKFVTAPMGGDMRFDLKAIKTIFDEENHRKNFRLIFIANPNNPTGTYVSSDELKGFLEGMKNEKETLIVIDEAYLEFVEAEDYPDSVSLVKQYSNVW
jgi:histidinol-phosphate aminotransferase